MVFRGLQLDLDVVELASSKEKRNFGRRLSGG